MVVLRCTQKLLARLKQSGPFPEIASTTRLGDWYGNILQIRRRQFLLFISEHTRLAVVLPITDGKRLREVFPEAVAQVLRAVGISDADIAAERGEMSEIAFGRTRNRSLLGTLNDFAFMAEGGVWQGREPQTQEELMRFLADTPIIPLKTAPNDLTRAIFRGPEKGAKVIPFRQ